MGKASKRKRKLRKHMRGRNKHHRKPRNLGGSDAVSNISVVSVNAHRAYHILFSTMTPPQIAKVLSEVWIDPDWVLIAKKTPRE